jgi:hypothetical protein
MTIRMWRRELVDVRDGMSGVVDLAVRGRSCGGIVASRAAKAIRAIEIHC